MSKLPELWLEKPVLALEKAVLGKIGLPVM
jgi:hypothetical protein